MWSETVEGRKLVQEISKTIVDQVAPEEVDLFEELAEEYFENPSPPDSSSTAKDDPLGFGLNEALIAVTPAALAMVNGVLTYLTTDVIKVAQEETMEAVRLKIRELFRAGKQDSAPKSINEIPSLTKEQLELIRKVARKQAILFKMKPEQAEKMANGVIGLLALK